MKPLLAALALLAALGAFTAPARADQYPFKRTIDLSTPASGAATLAVSGLNGNIRLYADGGSTVRVHAVLAARTAGALRLIDVRPSKTGTTLRVEDVCPSTQHFFFWEFADCNIDLEVHYPRAMAVNLASKNGNIALDGASAAVNVKNDNGNIHIAGAGGAVSVTNKNGNVTVENAPANLSLSDTNGNVSATLASGWHGTAIVLHTNAGNVHLRVPRNFSANVTAHARVGDVRNSANLRSGPASVTATTTFGNVVITRT